MKQLAYFFNLMIHPVVFTAQSKTQWHFSPTHLSNGKINRFVLLHRYMFRLVRNTSSCCCVKVCRGVYYKNFSVTAVCVIN